MKLSKNILQHISNAAISVPQADYFSLPEKVLQFGTGVLLRGLPDYYIDKANKQGIFNGRIVVVKSTGNGGTDAFEEQDGLFTHCIQGIENGEQVSQTIINASISRVLSAASQWEEILNCATNPEMQVVISNTTEVGISLVEDDRILGKPPVSFPGKLLAFLYQRYLYFKGDPEKGMVIVPTELIPGNGKRLQTISLKLAVNNQLEDAFICWLKDHNQFCDTLVDRIVPGKLSKEEQSETEARVGYTDELMIMSEPYGLWAIESESENVKEVLSFAQTDSGVVITSDIEKYRELKLRVLNATHILCSGLALYAGIDTVKDAMDHKAFSSYMEHLVREEIIPAITSDDVTEEEAIQFAEKVFDRFRNPYIAHYWRNITVQYTLKMRMRVVPMLFKFVERENRLPDSMAAGIAAYLLFMQTFKNEKGEYFSTINKNRYQLQDEFATLLHDCWNNYANESISKHALELESCWNCNLDSIKGLSSRVAKKMHMLQQGSIEDVLSYPEKQNKVA